MGFSESTAPWPVAAPGGTSGGSRAVVSRGSQAVPRERLVAVRSGPGAPRPGEGSRGGEGRRPIRPSVGGRRRGAHRFAVLGSVGPRPEVPPPRTPVVPARDV